MKSTKIRVDECDFIYMSYDEPQAELFWAELLEAVPWAKRVHGVKGFDAAHKACGEKSTTDRFFTMDGDNRLDGDVLDKIMDIPEGEELNTYSWAGKNHINGLVYGNGGIKSWHRTTMMKMRSHEAGNGPSVDFCWDPTYVTVKGAYSTTYQNGSPYQAYRAGFREGVKMLLDRGEVIPVTKFHTLWEGNIRRLEVWCSVGSDVPNGDWAIFGARDGVSHLVRGEDHSLISDYEWFIARWNLIKDRDPVTQIKELQPIMDKVGLKTEYLSPMGSRFFKEQSAYRPSRSEKSIFDE